MSAPLPHLPWQKVGMDLFELNGKHYVVVVDYYSRFLEIIELCNKTFSDVVRALKSTFACYGVPMAVFSDNGPCYTAEFTVFAKNYECLNMTRQAKSTYNRMEQLRKRYRQPRSYFVKQMTPTSLPCCHIAQRRSSTATRRRNCSCADNLGLLCQSLRRLGSFKFRHKSYEPISQGHSQHQKAWGKCGMTQRHEQHQCPARNVRCHNCGKRGHYDKVCRVKGYSHSRRNEQHRRPCISTSSAVNSLQSTLTFNFPPFTPQT
jgi:hypothetical protein